jgi:DNA-binding LacI/PurR family transcriptional regulator/signal transduction histidine kinase
MIKTSYSGKTVAFCTSSMTIRLSREIWAGIQEACEKIGVNTICYTGELLYPADYETNQTGANVVYDFINPETVDGVIVYTADIGEKVGDARMQELCESFQGLPVVSIAWEIPSVPTILIDNYEGMYSLVEHLVVEHSYKRIAFVQGPPDNPEAVDRYKAYCDVLEKHHIDFDEQLVCPGDFNRFSGRDAVDKLINQRKLNVDAIVSVDDETAVGVNEALKNLNLRVPEDIAIAGFDNEAMSGVMSSPLTTVEQPVYREGELALDTIIDIWNGKDAPAINKIPTELVIRSSCGCQERSFSGIPGITVESLESGVEDNLESISEEMFESALQIAKEQDLNINSKDIKRLVTTLVNGHKTGYDREFSEILWTILRNISERGEFVSPVQTLLSKFHQLALKILHPSALIEFENILHRARILIGNIAEQVNGFLRIDAVEKLMNLGDINYIVNAHYERKKTQEFFSEIADRNFNRLGIKQLHLVLYSDPEFPLMESQLIFSWEDGNEKEIVDEDVVFNTHQLLPARYEQMLREKHFTVCPLFFDKDQYGYIVSEIDPRDAMVCDILSWQISSAFYRVDLIERENERRSELEHSLRELKLTQRRLIEAEKMASLGDIVSGVAHEINTPIGAAVTYASYFEDLNSSMLEKFDKGKITKSEFEKFLNKGAEVSRGLLLNLNRAAKQISSFKEVAVDQTSAEKRKFNVKKYIEEIVFTLQKKISQQGHKISVVCPTSLTLNSYPGQLSQIITNLIMNSLHHAFDEGVVGKLSIAVTKSDKQVIIKYSDNGKGLKSKVKSKIFEPFFTTKRAQGGSGLGMHIVYNLVTQSLGGHIVCKSEENEGVTFTITIPTND